MIFVCLMKPVWFLFDYMCALLWIYHIHMQAYTHTHTHTHTHTNTQLYTPQPPHTHIHTHKYTQTHIYLCDYICSCFENWYMSHFLLPFLSPSFSAYVCVCMGMCVTCVCVCVCVCVCFNLFIKVRLLIYILASIVKSAWLWVSNKYREGRCWFCCRRRKKSKQRTAKRKRESECSSNCILIVLCNESDCITIILI